MKEIYSKPVVEVEEFKSADVVTTSYVEPTTEIEPLPGVGD